MPVVIVCGVCGRSEVPLRKFEMVWRGYLPGKKKISEFMRRRWVGSTDLCEPCLFRALGSEKVTFKDLDETGLQGESRTDRSIRSYRNHPKRDFAAKSRNGAGKAKIAPNTLDNPR